KAAIENRYTNVERPRRKAAIAANKKLAGIEFAHRNKGEFPSLSHDTMKNARKSKAEETVNTSKKDVTKKNAPVAKDVKDEKKNGAIDDVKSRKDGQDVSKFEAKNG